MPTETGRFSATGEITGSGASEKKTRASNTFGMTGKDGAAAVWMPMQIWCGPFITWMGIRWRKPVSTEWISKTSCGVNFQGRIRNSGACIPMMHREILWRHRKTARIITIPMIQREESLANGHGERRFMKTIMMHAAA